jgi:hypothetical protein
MNMYRIFIAFIFLATIQAAAQRLPDETFMSNIKTIKLNRAGDPLSFQLLPFNLPINLNLILTILTGVLKIIFIHLHFATPIGRPLS